MLQYAAPIGFAVFLWWFSTGAILFLDGLPKRTFRWSLLAAAAILALSIYGLTEGRDDLTVGGAYAAFSYGLLAWAWQEISFYMGAVTGIRTVPCPEGCSGWRHFGHAIRVSLFHELSIIATGLVLYAVVWPGANHVGLWTYVALWWMHQSAKLNVFLGVRNLNEEFLPDHMAFLKSFLTKKPMNLLFPVSVTISTVVAVLLLRAGFSPAATDFARTNGMLLGGLMALAILEHWFLVLPLPSAALWRWSLGARDARKSCDVEVVAGFLGAGKTTYVRRLLASSGTGLRTLVLVNDFGALGIDGALLAGRGADVVELPNGCVCCSLSRDLAHQLRDMIARMEPDRVIIEPSGVADLASLLAVLHRPDVKPSVRDLKVVTIVDAASFLADYARMGPFIESQAALATSLILNKCDVADPADLPVAEATLQSLNPFARIARARHGLVQAVGFEGAGQAVGRKFGGQGSAPRDIHVGGHGVRFASWSARLTDNCRPKPLMDLLDAVADGAYGQIERVKGITRAGAGWVRFDVSGGRSSLVAFAPRRDEEQRVTAIGRTVDGVRLQAAFAACAEQGGGSC